MSFNTANTILPKLKGWCELRTALRKQQLCQRTSDEIRSCIRKTVTTYSCVRPTHVLPVNSEVLPLVCLASGPTGLLASVDVSLVDQLL